MAKEAVSCKELRFRAIFLKAIRNFSTASLTFAAVLNFLLDVGVYDHYISQVWRGNVTACLRSSTLFRSIPSFAMSASSDDIIRHIIRDIVARASTILKFRRGESQPSTVAEPGPDGSAGTQQAAEPGHVTETLAAFMVRAVVLDPRNEFKIERELGKDEVDRLIKVRRYDHFGGED